MCAEQFEPKRKITTLKFFLFFLLLILSKKNDAFHNHIDIFFLVLQHLLLLS